MDRILRSGRVAGGVILLALAVSLPLSAMPESIRIPIVREHEDGYPADAALFSHWGHDRYKCYNCHPSIFRKSRYGFTHDELEEGRYCATCHDGKQAWAIDDADECETCHVESR